MTDLKILAFVSICALTFSGCAVMSEDECRVANWGDVGYDDGINGQPSSKLKEYREACSKYVAVDARLYAEGRSNGSKVFCTNENGFKLGQNGHQVSDICLVSGNQANFSKYYTRGMSVYYANDQLRILDEKIQSYDAYINDSSLNSLSSQLRANQVYLYNLRVNLVKYVEYVNDNAYDYDITRQDYANSINAVPYPRAAQTADSIRHLIRNRDDANHEINRRIDDDNRCMDKAVHQGKGKEPDIRQFDRCKAHAQCLRREQDHLNRDVDRIIRSVRGDEGSLTLDTHYYNYCR
jgi:hypothetical protein